MVESRTTNIFRAEFDEEGVYVYQAFRDSIADYALAHGRFGVPDFNPARMSGLIRRLPGCSIAVAMATRTKIKSAF